MKKLIMSAFAAMSFVCLFAQKTHHIIHPRVHQVNKRIVHQEKEITKDRKDGDITKVDAKEDRTDLKNINQQKKDMKKLDNGHLTKQDDKTLNQELNANQKQIKNQ